MPIPSANPVEIKASHRFRRSTAFQERSTQKRDEPEPFEEQGAGETGAPSNDYRAEVIAIL